MKLSEIIKDLQTVIVCKNKSEAKRMCEILDMAGLVKSTWNSGTLMEELNFIEPHLKTYDIYGNFQIDGYTMIPFQEVEFDCIDFGYLKGSKPLTKKVSSQPQHTDTPIINWEQRRYEIAKYVLGVLAARDGMASEYELNIERAATYAYELIEKIKEKHHGKENTH